MEALLEHDLYNNFFGNEVKYKLNDSLTLETRVQIWGTIVRRGVQYRTMSMILPSMKH